MQTDTYDFTTTLQDIEGGVFLAKLSRAIRDTALGTVTHGENKKTGKVVVEFTMSRLTDTGQIMLAHKLKYTCPTLHGDTSETSTTKTPLFVSGDGALSIMPENQGTLNFENTQEEN